jgi:hypothetical protein
MKRALIRLAAVAASCCLLAGGLALPAEAATPVPPTNVIAIPNSDQATDTVGASLCRLLAIAAAPSGSVTKAGDADSQPMSKAVAASYVPLVAALCGMLGG